MNVSNTLTRLLSFGAGFCPHENICVCRGFEFHSPEHNPIKNMLNMLNERSIGFLFWQLKGQQYGWLYPLKWGKLWLIRVFQAAIFDLSNHNSHSSLLHQCWWGYFRTNSLSRRNMGLTSRNNIKHRSPHHPESPSTSSGVQIKLLIRLLQIRWGKGMTPHLEIIA